MDNTALQRHIVEGIALRKALIGRLTADGRDVRLAPNDRSKQCENAETDYHCYFLRPVRSSLFGVPSSIAARESFRAETDVDARINAENIYGQRRHHIYGFELWQGNRLVYRRATGSDVVRLSSWFSTENHALESLDRIQP